MISPSSYVNRLKDKLYPDLIKERDRLIRLMQQYEQAEMAGDRSDPAWMEFPQPSTQYQMHFEYLAALCQMMQEKYNEEYVWGKRTLKQDKEEQAAERVTFLDETPCWPERWHRGTKATQIALEMGLITEDQVID